MTEVPPEPDDLTFSLSAASRLLNGSTKKLHTWLDLVAREGDVHGLASLGDDLVPPAVP